MSISQLPTAESSRICAPVPHIPHMETIAKTAELYGVSQYFVRKLANSGKINAVRIAGRILINCDKLTEYLNNATLCDTVDRSTVHTENGIRRLW